MTVPNPMAKSISSAPTASVEHQKVSVPKTTSSPKAKAGVGHKLIQIAVFGTIGTIFVGSVIVKVGELFSRPNSSGLKRAYGSPGNAVEVITAQLQASAAENKQMIFDGIHPVGTATAAVVNNVDIIGWKNGFNTNKAEDVRRYVVRLTIYWKSPLIDNGYTQIASTYDTEIGRFINSQVLETNGTTNQNVGEAIGAIGAAMLYDALTR